jgi:hypothetical protein
VTFRRGTKHDPAPENSAHHFLKRSRIRRTFAASIRVPQSQSAIQGASERQEEAQQGSLIRDSDEWIKRQSDGKKVRFSYQLLISGYSASAEIIEPAAAAMIYTHIHTDLPAPTGREQIEAEFADDLTKGRPNPRFID